MTIIEVSSDQRGFHNLQSQTGWDKCWLDGWIEVPPQLEAQVWDTLGWCNLNIQGGVLVGITPIQRPDPPEPESKVPTAEERLAALESAMLTMMGGGADV